MSYERLLYWMSEIGSGGFDQFERSHTWATRGETIWRTAPSALRELSALAHIEINWATREWGAVPPCITLLPDAAGHGLVVGGRTGRLTETLLEELDALDAVAVAHQQRDAPDALYVAADSEHALAEVAGSLGLEYVHSVVEDLATVLPGLDAMSAGRRTHPIVQHYGIERYDFDERWLATDADDEPGLYRYDRSGPRAIHYVEASGTRLTVDFGVGVWLESRRQGTNGWIWWHPDAVNGTLDVPMNLPLPALHARAATLCSGLIASLDDGSLRFANVPQWLAESIAKSLDQALVIK